MKTHPVSRIVPVLATLAALAVTGYAQERQHHEIQRYPVAEARQGVAVDEVFFFVVTNTAIGKYRRDSGEKVAEWSCPEGDPLIHMNDAMLFEGRLYASHSNYSGVPSTSSIEIFDAETLEHVDSISLGHGFGSFTWLDRLDGEWYACFAYYGNKAAEPGRDPSWTQLIRFDPEFRRLEGWVFPPGLIEKFDRYSCSGGAFGPDGRMYVTGHDEQELYVVEFPEAGSTLVWVDTIPIEAEGQALSFDPSDPWVLWTILKRNREVIVGRIDPPVEVAE
jgi:outer membrane protein assembly factor BamB